MFAKAPNRKSLVVLFLLIIAGFMGNYCTVPLFFGADFLVGGIAVLLILYCYGLSWGMFAAVIVHIIPLFSGDTLMGLSILPVGPLCRHFSEKGAPESAWG